MHTQLQSTGPSRLVLGFNLSSIQAIPGGLWELFIGVWLIVKGFGTSSQFPSGPTISSTTSVLPPPLVAALRREPGRGARRPGTRPDLVTSPA
jgi:hypothetical protein